MTHCWPKATGKNRIEVHITTAFFRQREIKGACPRTIQERLPPKDVFGADTPIPIRDMVPRALTRVHNLVRDSAAPETPIIISEFNAAYLNRVDIEDSAFMGPWLANTIRACDVDDDDVVLDILRRV